MAISTLIIGDGVTDLDFHSYEYKVLAGGVQIPPPVLEKRFISSPFVNGNQLAGARYKNRIITVSLLIQGTSLSDLRDNVRALERMLTDAKDRYLSDYKMGLPVYMQYQWGTTAGEYVYYDIMSGSLTLANNFQSPWLFHGYMIHRATLTLICEPFGRFANQVVATDVLENSQSIYDCPISQLTSSVVFSLHDTDDRACQTFTTVSTQPITHIAVELYKGAYTDLTGLMTVNLYATLAGEPTGAVLATGTYDTDDLGANIGDWLVIPLTVPYTPLNATVYCFVLDWDDIDAVSTIELRYVSPSAYAGGNYVWSDDAGASWTIQVTQDLAFAVITDIAAVQLNYQDIAAVAGYGDVPAKLYQMLTPANGNGSKKVWLSKRTGDRQTDDLWYPGREYTSVTDIEGLSYSGSHLTEAIGESDEQAIRAWYEDATGGVLTDTPLMRFNFTLANLPFGKFRVLVKTRVTAETAASFDKIGFALGWTYGGASFTPTAANTELETIGANSTWGILDLGILNIPPVPGSDIADNNVLELRIYIISNATLDVNKYVYVDIGFIFLLPTDEGLVIVDGIAAADLLAMDNISDRNNVYILTAGELISSVPAIEGAPFSLGRESTRLYMIRDDVKEMTYASDIIIQPQFMET